MLSGTKVYIPTRVIQFSPCLTPDWVIHNTPDLLLNQRVKSKSLIGSVNKKIKSSKISGEKNERNENRPVEK